MSTKKKTSPVSIVREIKRKTRRKFTAEEKIRIVLEGLRGEESIADLCRREGIHPTMYYKWSKAFDELGYFISESSVYRILKAKNLVTSPVYTLISAKDKFEDLTTRVNHLWQVDFTYLKIVHWGWHYLLTVLDDYSRYIIAWRLCNTMRAEDVKETLDMAIAKTGVKHVHVYQRPRLLSDNGPCLISQDFREYLEKHEIDHIRTKAYHPMTQGKIERYHRSMKNVILLDIYYLPEELRARIGEWVEYYNNHRYHEAIDNVTPSDKYFGRDQDILKRREKLKIETFDLRRKLYQKMAIQNLIEGRT